MSDIHPDFDRDIWVFLFGRPQKPAAHLPAFSMDELAQLRTIWNPARIGGGDRGAVATSPAGEQLQIGRYAIEAPSRFDPQWFRAAMRHIDEVWGGAAMIPADPRISVSDRLWARAYAEVYGVRLDDANELFTATALTADQLAGLADLRRQIRATHPDAPPERQGEAQELAGLQARRYPFRTLAAV